MADKKTWAIIVGSAAGLTAAIIGAAWYVRSQGDHEIKTVQDKIQWAHQKLDELEQVANVLRKPLSAS